MPVVSEERNFPHYQSLVIHYEGDVSQQELSQADRFIKHFMQSTQRRPVIILDLSGSQACSDALFRQIVDHAMNASLGSPLKPRLMMASSQRELHKIFENLVNDTAAITFRPTIPRIHAEVVFSEMMTQTKAL